MLFKFIEKPLIIEAFVPDNYILAKECFPILPSSRYMPDWWRKIPTHKPTIEQPFSPNAKSCTGIMETFKNGYIQPMWSDILFKITEGDWACHFADQQVAVTTHANSQLPNFYNDYWFVKFESPWIFRFSHETKVVFTDFFYSSDKPKPYLIPYGIKDTIKKQMIGNFFIFLPKSKLFEFEIKAGTPMIHLIPLTSRQTIIKNEVITTQEWNRMNSMLTLFPTFTNKLRKTKTFMKKVLTGRNLI